MENIWHNKLALISGGTSGIGLATAELLLKKGAGVLLLGRSKERGEMALAHLAAKGYTSNFWFQAVDVSHPEECAEFMAGAAEQRVKIDFLVNCAGSYEEQWLQEITEADYNRLLDSNLKSTIFLTKEVLPFLGNNSAIVNVASDAGIRGNYGCPLYSAAKGAVVAFTRAMAMDLAPKTRVNCVCPGDVDTPLVDKQLEDGGYTKEEMAEVYPLGRIGKPEEVAQVICGLLSPENSFMTGAIVPVDGGLTAKG